MHVIRTESDLQALEDPDLLDLIRRRIADTAEFVDTFGELVFFVMVQPGDDIAAVDGVLGFPVMANRFDGTAFGEPGFTPSWDVLEDHAGCYELVYVLSDDGQGVTVFVAKAEGAPPELLAMCRQFAPLEADT